MVASTAYDFDGHVTRAMWQLAIDYTTTPSWSSLATITDPSAVLAPATSLLESETFETQTVFDALDHVVQLTTPDGSVTVSSYSNQAQVEADSVAHAERIGQRIRWLRAEPIGT